MSTYLSRPLLDIKPDFEGVSSGLLDDFTYDMLASGRGTPWKVTAGPRRTVIYPFALNGRAAIGSFRGSFSDRAGRRAGFWLPVYLLDFKLTADAAPGDTVLAVQNVGLASALASFSQFGHLALTNWSLIECAQIASVVASGGGETITLSAPLANAWRSGATICGGLIFARPAEDEIDYSFRALGYCRATVKFVELPAEYAAPEAGSAPVYAYEFTRSGQTWRYVDCGADLVLSDSNTWKAGDLTHGDIAAGLEFVSEPVELRVATDDATHPLRARGLLAETYVAIYETDLDTLTINTAAPVYKGRIENLKTEDKGLIVFNLSSVLRVSELTGPKPQMQRICNHSVYDQYCQADPATFTATGTISALSSDPAFVEATAFGDAAASESDPNWLALGRVTSGTEQRLCVGQVGNRLYLNAPFSAAIVGDAVSARAGCDRRPGTCKLKFNNIVNFLGCPYMPNQSAQFEALTNPQPAGGKKG